MSEIVTDIEQKYKVFKEYDFSYFKDIDLVETDKNAFELMSERFYENTPFYSSLKEYFKNDSRYSSIEYIAQNKPLIIKDKKKAKELFGKDMYISAFVLFLAERPNLQKYLNGQL